MISICCCLITLSKRKKANIICHALENTPKRLEYSKKYHFIEAFFMICCMRLYFSVEVGFSKESNETEFFLAKSIKYWTTCDSPSASVMPVIEIYNTLAIIYCLCHHAMVSSMARSNV